MTTLYNRMISLVIGTSTGNALDLSQMRIHFRTHKATVGTPNILECRIWNLSNQTAQTLTASVNGEIEFNKVVLSAGYVGGPFGIIFSGDVSYFRKGRESPTDTYLDIYATDSGKAHLYAVVNASVPQNSNNEQLLNVVNQQLVAQGASTGVSLPFVSDFQMPRGRVCFGKASDYARSIASDVDAQWSIQDGTIQYVPRTTVLLNPVVEVNSATGMIGIPVQTIYGVEVTMLLNPNIKFGAALRINNADIQTANLDLSYGGVAQNGLNQLGSQFLAADGLYKVIAGEYEGDTRAGPWFLKAVCVSLDGSTSNAAAQAGWIPGP